MKHFPTTQWSEILQAARGDQKRSLEFAVRYRPAVVEFLRWLGYSEEQAEDLAQEVFLDLLRRNVLADADPSKGKFRSLLMSVTRHVASVARQREAARRRGGDARMVPLDEVQVATAAKQEEMFDRIWAEHLVSLALDDLSRENPAYYQALHLSLEGKSYAEIARAMAKSLAEIKNYVYRAKAWVRRAVRERISEYAATPEAMKEELDRLGRFDWK